MKWIFALIGIVFSQLEIQAYVYANPPYQTCPIQKLDDSFILSVDEKHRNKAIQFVKKFNFDEYQIHMVPNLGKFFLEASGKRDWIKDILRGGDPWEGYIASYIQTYAKPGTVVLDVGAHIGTHTLNLSRAVGEKGKVIAFEPRMKTFAELFLNAQINGAQNIFCFWGALGDKNEEIRISACHPEVEVACLSDFTFGALGYTVPLITLDSLNLSNISFMKVDVDGFDEMFLDGAKETILRNKPVLMMEIIGGYDPDVDTASSELKLQLAKIKQKIIDLGYDVQKISIHDYLCIPL